MSNRITKQYIAGFFDGEGCLSTERNYISITNTNLKILKERNKNV